MRRLVIAFIMLLTAGGGLTTLRHRHHGLSVTLEAQSLPITKQFCWDDAVAGADGVLTFLPTQDAAALPAVGPTVFCVPVTFTTLGTHTLSVAAVNVWTSTASQVLTVNVKAPTAPTNPRIQ